MTLLARTNQNFISSLRKYSNSTENLSAISTEKKANDTFDNWYSSWYNRPYYDHWLDNRYKYYPDGTLIGLRRRCSKCNILVYPFESYERNGLLYCEKDYHSHFSQRCSDCHEPIKNPTDMQKIFGKPYHYDHVRCSECRIRLFDKYRLRGGKLYCEYDFHRLFSPDCTVCAKPIRHNALQAVGKNYHRDTCFRCDYCYKKLDETNYFAANGKPYCRVDWFRMFSSKCHGCKGTLSESIYGKSTFAIGNYWHPKCFKCNDCFKQLTDYNYRELENKPYCREHFHKRTCKECNHKFEDYRSISPARSESLTWKRSTSPFSFFYRPKSSLR